jgi:two-component system, NarL family, response regulator LiaR
MEKAGTASKSQATILIVEDHDALRNSLGNWLTSIFQDCVILQARTGEEALGLCHAHLPEIVLMDIMLPEMSGIETARLVKGVVPDAHVVMLSIYEDSAYKTDAAAAGAKAYISKRKMGTELVPLIAELLSGKGSRPLNEE